MDPVPPLRLMRTAAVAAAWLAAVAGATLVFAVRPEHSFTGDGATLVLAGLVLAIASDASVGAILTLRRPGNVVGLVLLLGPILLAATLLTWVSGAALAEQRGGHDFLAGLTSLIGAIGFAPSILVAGPLLALLFPDGRLPGPRWKWPVGALVAAIALAVATGVFHPGPIPETVVTNPLGASGFSGSEAFWAIGFGLYLASVPVALLLALVSVIVRVRRAADIERAQLKWFVAAIVAVGMLLMLGFADGGLDIGLAAGTTPTIFDLLAVASLSLPAIAVGIAILRYRLFEIDRIISRTLSWAIVTGLLVAVYGAVVVALQAALVGLTQGQTLAVAGSTLVAFALFQPLRRRVQSAVDRRFDRARYDTQRTVEVFAGQLRDEMDLTRLRAALVGVADDAVHPSGAAVWLRAGSERGS
jgi:hypothetical protein